MNNQAIGRANRINTSKPVCMSIEMLRKLIKSRPAGRLKNTPTTKLDLAKNGNI